MSTRYQSDLGAVAGDSILIMLKYNNLPSVGAREITGVRTITVLDCVTWLSGFAL